MLIGYNEARHEIRGAVIEVVTHLSIANKLALQALESGDGQGLKQAQDSLKTIPDTTEKIDNNIVLLFAKFSPEARDLREMVSYLKITSSLNRIRTNIKNYIKNMQGVVTQNNTEVHQIIKNSLSINRCTLHAFDAILEMFQTFDDRDKIEALATKIAVEYSKTDDIYAILEKELIQKIGSSHTVAEEYFNLLKYIRKNLKIIDRLESISSRIIFARIGGKL